MAEVPRSDWLWPTILIGLLGSMIAGSLGFYAIALRYPDAQVVPDAYAAGLAWNEQREIAERAAARGLVIEIEPSLRDDSALVQVSLHASEGAQVPRAERVRVRRERPTQGGFDQEFELERHGDTFAGEIPLPLPGRWHLVARVWSDGEEMRQRTRLWRP